MLRLLIGIVWPTSALVVSARENNLEKVKQFLANYKDDPSKLNTEYDAARYNMTALHFAAMYGSELIVEELLAAGADVNVKDINGESPLLTACSHGKTAVALRLLLVPGVEIDCKTKQGYTAIMLAAEMNLGEVFNKLLNMMSSDSSERFASLINYQANISKDTVLSCAAVKGRRDFVAALLAIPDLDLAAVDRYKHSAAANARWYGYVDIADMIDQEMQRRLVSVSDAADVDVDVDVDVDTDDDDDDDDLDDETTDSPTPYVIPNALRNRLEAIGFCGKIPAGFICPISGEIMSDPVTVCSGRTYDRSSLQIWFGRHPDDTELEDPINRKYTVKRAELENGTSLILKDAIEAFVDKCEKNESRKLQSPVSASAAAAAAAPALSEEEKREEVRKARILLFDKKHNDKQNDRQPSGELTSSASPGPR